MLLRKKILSEISFSLNIIYIKNIKNFTYKTTTECSIWYYYKINDLSVKYVDDENYLKLIRKKIK